MKRFSIIFLLLSLFLPLTLTAQQQDDNNKREHWLKEMREKKHEFLIRELQLKPEQQQPFFEVYDKMDDQLRAINDETRQLERKVLKNPNSTDLEYNAAIDAVYNQRYREWEVENKAKEELVKILSPQQLIKLKRAELKFQRALMKQHRQPQHHKDTK